MMNSEIKQILNHYLKRWKKPLNPSETDPVNSSGLNNSEETVNGSGSTKTFSLKNVHNILIKYTSEPNTTMTHMIRIPPSSNEIYFSIMNRDSSPEKTEDGISKESGST